MVTVKIQLVRLLLMERQFGEAQKYLWENVLKWHRMKTWYLFYVHRNEKTNEYN